MARAEEQGAQDYEALLKRAEEDPTILAFWLGGSRGKGRPTEHSDYDIMILVAEDAYKPFCRELGLEGSFQGDWRPGIDLGVGTLRGFEAAAAWDSPERGYRYGHAHVKALLDKTGKAQALIDAKACVPRDAVAAFIDASLDHAINQAYRALKCLRDGDPGASRLEAAEGVNPFFDAVFALHGGRLRPYYKYLRWELENWPLSRLPTGGTTLMERALQVLGPDGGPRLCALLTEVRPVFEAAGHTAVYDGWGEKLDWILKGESGATP
ncbi:MAG TPA: nucleotidyltransferase domain-containing protein [Caulobacteraceae bacterium]